MNETEIILGPPGTGKTTTLLGIVDEELTRGVPANEIGYFSFTRRAFNEAISRACTKFSLQPKDLPYIRTLHSLCFRALNLRGDSIFKDSTMYAFGKEVGFRMTGSWSEDGTFAGNTEGDRLLFMNNKARVRCISLMEQYDQDDDGLPRSTVLSFDEQLRAYKEREGLWDFTDMMVEYHAAGPRPQLRTLIVDEAQDLSQLQWRVVNKLSQDCERVVVAGDDDQAIYPWAGADINHFVNLPGRVRVLEQSWRVPAAMQELAARVISSVTNRRPKQWIAREGSRGVLDDARHFDNIDLSETEDTLILARNRFVVNEQIIPELRRRGLVYEYDGVSSINRGVQNAIVWWERLRRGEAITVEQARVVYDKMRAKHGYKWGFKEIKQIDDGTEVTMADLRARGGLLADGPWFDALDHKDIQAAAPYVRSVLAQGHKLTTSPKIRVSTIHGSKGGQADRVVLLKDMAWRSWREYEQNPDDEARVWYVAITRAKERLTLVESNSPQGYPL